MIFNIGESSGLTIGVESFKREIGEFTFLNPSQNVILIKSNIAENGSNLTTSSGIQHFDPTHFLVHEIGHAIVNSIMNLYGRMYNGVDFKKMSPTERLDWAIRFTNLLGNKETGEGQHGRSWQESSPQKLNPTD